MDGDEELISKRTTESVKQEIKKLAIKYKNQIQVKYSFSENKECRVQGVCPAVDKFLYINNLGQVSPCTWVISQNPEYKSKLTLKNSTFAEVIKSEPIKNYLKYIEENQINGCPVSRREQ